MASSSSPFTPNPPAPEQAIAALVESTAAKPLPLDYLMFLRMANGGEGFLGENYAALWRTEELIEFNREYQTAELAAMLFLFGSNGGGEAYAFDQSAGGSTVFSVPFIGMEYRYIEKVADSFRSFIAAAFLSDSESGSLR